MPLDYVTKFDVAAEASDNILSSVKNFTVATATDVVATLWNSVTPQSLNASTADLLEKVDKDSLAFYNEHTDAVRTASMIGGSFIPGGVALKLLGRMRAGVSAAGYTESGIASAVRGAFTGQRAKKLELEIEQTFAQAGAGTKEYKNLTRQLYATNIGKELIDNTIIEIAVVGAMNAHPYMEDYLKDPLQNFALGVGIGGVLGTALAIPLTGRAIRNLEMPLERQAIQSIFDAGYQPIYYRDNSFSEAAAIQRHQANAKILNDLIFNKDSNELVKDVARRGLKSEGDQMAYAFERAAPWAAKAEPEVKAALMEILGRGDFAGVDGIKDIDITKKAGKGTSKNVVFQSPELMKDEMQQALIAANNKANPTNQYQSVATNFLTSDGKAAIAFTRLSDGATFAGDVRNISTAADIPSAAAQVQAAKNEKTAAILVAPNRNTLDNMKYRKSASAQDDLDTLIEMARVSKVKEAEIPYATIASDDTRRMNAFLMYAASVGEDKARKLNFRFSNEFAYHDAIVKKVESGGLGVKPTYFEDVTNVINEGKVTYQGPGSWSTTATDEVVNAWIHGGDVKISGRTEYYGIDRAEVTLRRAFDTYFRGALPQDIPREFSAAAKEMYEKGFPFRNAMMQHADAEGYVYLYRGYGGKTPKGQSAVESYTISERIARSFNDGKDPALIRVKVDNIVGALGRGNAGEYEIFVAASDPQIVKNPTFKSMADSAAVTVDPAALGMQHVGIDELYHIYANETTRQIQELIGTKVMSFEEISARTNTTLDGVKAVAAGRDLANYESPWRRYTTLDDVDKYLDPRNKLYAIMGNPEKNPNSSAMAKLDGRSLSVAQKEIHRQMTLQANAMIGNDVLDLYTAQAMDLQVQKLQANLAEFGNASVGNVKLQSADQILRNTETGNIATFLGKQLIDRVDAMKKRLLEPLAAAFTPFRGKPEFFTEFNETTNRLYSLSGWRDIRTDPTTGYGYIVQRQSVEGKIAEIPLKNGDGTTYYIKQPEVLSALESTRSVSNEMLKTHNLVRSMMGHGPMNDLGFYLPPINLVGKSVAYVIDNTGTEGIKLLVANKEDELASLIKSYTQANADKFAKGQIAINTKVEMNEYNHAKGFTDYEASITYADNAKFHTGSSAQAITPSDDRFVNNIMSGYENLNINLHRKYAEVYMGDTFGWLDKLSDYYKRNVDDQPKQGLFKESPKDYAQVLKNILLGRDQLESSVGLKAVNSLTDFLYNRASTAVNSVARSFQTEKVGSKKFFDSLNETLRQKGIESPWKSFDEYLATTVAETRNIAPKLQSAANGLLATLNLRMFEVAQAAVNVMSLPILTWSALMEKLPGTMINPQGSSIKFPLETMMNGMKHMWSPEGKRLDQIWESQGLLSQVTRQYTETTASLKGAGQGREFMDKAVDVANGIQNNKWIKNVFSKPADFAEELTRKFAMHTGYLAAKQAYPAIDDTAATIAAVAFADRTIGNYHAAQRPAMFQGTFGAAIGLYQTYVLTYAQSIYRGLENRNFQQLASLTLAQAGIFGISSWPGYQTLSEHVVGHISDQHIDLTTGTYRAISDPAARLILYGLPSSLGPAFYTRGDVSPRIPSSMSEIAVYNGIKQGWSAASLLMQKAGEGLQNGTFGQSMGEALSLQSLNRPIARWAEMVSGSSVTSKFNTVTPTSEMFTPAGVFARMIGTRPVEEQVTRDAVYKNRYYEAIDKDRRDAAVDQLATAIRANTLTSEIVSKTAETYLRHGGNARGWQSALNKVMLQSSEGTRLSMLRELEPTSPINMMIRDHY